MEEEIAMMSLEEEKNGSQGDVGLRTKEDG